MINLLVLEGQSGEGRLVLIKPLGTEAKPSKFRLHLRSLRSPLWARKSCRWLVEQEKGLLIDVLLWEAGLSLFLKGGSSGAFNPEGRPGWKS